MIKFKTHNMDQERCFMVGVFYLPLETAYELMIALWKWEFEVKYVKNDSH